LIDLDKDGFLSLMDDAGEIRSDLQLPVDEELRKEISDGFSSGAELVLTVLKAIGQEQVIQSRVTGK
jgi:hypothetical protein